MVNIREYYEKEGEYLPTKKVRFWSFALCFRRPGGGGLFFGVGLWGGRECLGLRWGLGCMVGYSCVSILGGVLI